MVWTDRFSFQFKRRKTIKKKIMEDMCLHKIGCLASPKTEFTFSIDGDPIMTCVADVGGITWELPVKFELIKGSVITMSMKNLEYKVYKTASAVFVLELDGEEDDK